MRASASRPFQPVSFRIPSVVRGLKGQAEREGPMPTRLNLILAGLWALVILALALLALISAGRI